MSTKRASLLTINSLTALSKVCSTRHSSDYVRTLNFLRNLSIAAERSEFQNPNEYHMDKSSEFYQSPTGFYNEMQNPVDFHQRRPAGQALNPNKEFRESPRNEYGKNLIGQTGSCSSVDGQNHVDSQQRFSGTYKSSDGVYREGFKSKYHNNMELGQNTNGAHAGSSRGSEMSPNGLDANYNEVCGEKIRNELPNNGPMQQSGNFGGYYGGNIASQQQYPSGIYTANSRGWQYNQPGFNRGDGNMQNQYGSYQGGPTEVRQNLNVFDSQGNPRSQGSLNGHYTHSAGKFQDSTSNPYTMNAGMDQPSPGMYQPTLTYGEHQNLNVGQHRWSQSAYQDNLNVGQRNQQNPNVGSYHLNTGDIQRTMGAPQVSTDPKPEGNSAEASENGQCIGTLEELDNFCKEGKVKEAVEVLGLLEKQHVLVDLDRVLHLMQVCGDAKALQEAKSVHEHVEKSLSPLKVSTYNRILEMYSKCGSMDDALSVFNNMQARNLTSWDTMITWLGKNGLGEDAVDLFMQFKKLGLKPDDQMFVGVFSACKDLGDINEGMLHFESMSKDYGIVPSMKHYLSVVDMLGSTGYLDEALEFIEKMPMEPSVDIWETLMILCRIHGHSELGDRCAELVGELQPSRLNEDSKKGLVPVKPSDLAKEQERKKLVSQNLLEVRSRVHEYRAGDTSHPENDKIYALLRAMRAQMKEAGYIPETRFVLHDIDQEGKEDALLAHSERLAVAYGLLSTPVRSPIRIIKNLRVCGDCHTALKIISKLVGRELIIRDAKRFHHFKDGLCSCRDYW